MKTNVIQVEVRPGRIVTFANDDGGGTAARNYAKKWGGKIITNAANAAIDGIAQSDSFPTPSPGLCNLLGLSTDALREPGEIRAAWDANLRRSAPRSTEKIVQALISYWRTKRGGDVDSTVAFLKNRHPLLFPDVLYKTAGTSGTSGANEERLAGNEEEMLAIGPLVKSF